MKVLAFLQNMWVIDPKRIEASITRHGEAYRRRLIAYALFAGCLTGRRLRMAFGRRIHRRHLEEALTLQKGKQLTLRPLHSPGLLVARPLVIMAGHMEDSVKKKEADSVRKGYPLFIRFAQGRIRGDYHIAEKMGVNSREISFTHGK